MSFWEGFFFLKKKKKGVTSVGTFDAKIGRNDCVKLLINSAEVHKITI
jgi:hypothetical protein